MPFFGNAALCAVGSDTLLNHIRRQRRQRLDGQSVQQVVLLRHAWDLERKQVHEGRCDVRWLGDDAGRPRRLSGLRENPQPLQRLCRDNPLCRLEYELLHRCIQCQRRVWEHVGSNGSHRIVHQAARLFLHSDGPCVRRLGGDSRWWRQVLQRRAGVRPHFFARCHRYALCGMVGEQVRRDLEHAERKRRHGKRDRHLR